MNDNENNKSMEALPDDALENVSGGGGLLDRHADHKTLEELEDEAVDSVTGGTMDFSGPQTLTPKELEELLAGQEEEGQKKR